MPYRTVWVKPEVFLKHKGVVVYKVYKNDDIESGPRTFSYTLRVDGGDDDSDTFDVRQLSTWEQPAHPGDRPQDHERYWRVTEPQAIKRAIRAAIDSGELQRQQQESGA